MPTRGRRPTRLLGLQAAPDRSPGEDSGASAAAAAAAAGQDVSLWVSERARQQVIGCLSAERRQYGGAAAKSGNFPWG